MQLTQPLKQQIIQAVAELVPDYQALYVFGSYASGEAREGSDIDIGVLCPDVKAGYDWFIVAGKLSSVIRIDVDLIQMRAVDDVINMQIITTGQQISAPDYFQAELFATHKFSDYVRLNEQRAPIIAQIKEQGQVYG